MKKMIRPVAFGSKTGLRREIFNVPCKNPDKHKELGFHHNKLCRSCHDKWYKSLPWRLMDEDDNEALGDKPRFTATFRDSFSRLGKEWEGVAGELFGIVIGESENPDDYPFGRILRKDEPKLIIHHLRSRFCFEPQRDGSPLYVEIQYRGFNDRRISIEGLKPPIFHITAKGPNLDITTKDELNKIWGLYDFLCLKEVPKGRRLTEAQIKHRVDSSRPRFPVWTMRGRPKNIKKPTKKHMTREDVITAIRVRLKNERPVSIYFLAKDFGINKAAMTKRIQRLKTTLEKLKELANSPA